MLLHIAKLYTSNNKLYMYLGTSTAQAHHNLWYRLIIDYEVCSKTRVPQRSSTSLSHFVLNRII